MRFVADESCDYSVVRSLRANAHDVMAIAEIAARASDDEVLSLALEQKRVLITEDKDFGELVYHAERQFEFNAARSVILLRFPSDARAAMPSALLKAIGDNGDALLGAFTVIQPGRIRISAAYSP